MTSFDPRCHWCTHPLRQKADDMLKRGVTYQVIAQTIQEEHPAIKLNYRALSHHKRHIVFFEVPADAVQVKVVEVQKAPEVDAETLKAMPEPNAWEITNRTLKRLDLVEKSRPLTLTEEAQRQVYLKFLIDVERNQIARKTVQDTEAQNKAKEAALKLIENLNAEAERYKKEGENERIMKK